MKTCLKILAVGLLALAVSCFGQEINPGVSFVDGQRLTAAQLAQLVNQATIQTPFYTDKETQTNLNPTDLLLVYNQSPPGVFHTISGNTAVFNNSAIISGQSFTYGTNQLNWYDSILVYDPTNARLAQAMFTNVAQTLSYDIFTGRPPWPNDLQQITNQPQLVVLDTNLVPYTETLSNVAPNLGWNLIPYTFQQLFTPYSYLGTNANTNVWALTNIFAITNLFIGTNTTPTLTDTDRVPVYAQGQLTNTTMTLGALYGYLTNKNTLPPYTTARIQFSGISVTLNISNDAQANPINLIHASTSTIFTPGNVYAVDFITNNTQLLWSTISTNTLYYVVPSATNANYFNVYSNYLNAAAGTNTLHIINQGSGNLNQMLYVTNYTSYNADVISLNSASAHIPGTYLVYFRTPAANPLYYVTANAMEIPNGNFNQSLVGIPYPPSTSITTNYFELQTGYLLFNTTGVIQSDVPLVHVLVNPQ